MIHESNLYINMSNKRINTTTVKDSYLYKTEILLNNLVSLSLIICLINNPLSDQLPPGT